MKTVTLKTQPVITLSEMLKVLKETVGWTVNKTRDYEAEMKLQTDGSRKLCR